MNTSCKKWKTLLCLICFAGLLLTGVIASADSPRVTMSVVDADVRDVLTGLATIGKVNVVIDDSVTGRISLNFQDIPFESALAIITKSKGLSMFRTENVVVFSTLEKMEKGFGQVEVFPLKYARADHIKNVIVGGGKSDSEFAVENPGAVTTTDAGTLKGTVTDSTKSSANTAGIKGLVINTDASTNSIIAFGAPEQIEKVRQLLKELDVPYQQILLEAQVVALTKEGSKSLGVDWTWAQFGTSRTSGTTTVNADNSVTVTSAGTTSLPIFTLIGKNGLLYDLGVNATVNALITKGEGKLLARPNVMTFNGNKATIFVGDQLPVFTLNPSSGGVASYTTTYKQAGITLSYVPRINDDGQITASVFVEVSTPKVITQLVGGQLSTAYQITARSAQTNVRMKDGDTLVIGGLISSSEAKSINKVPILGDLPIIGQLFRSLTTSRNETEVVIFLKAKIIK